MWLWSPENKFQSLAWRLWLTKRILSLDPPKCRNSFLGLLESPLYRGVLYTFHYCNFNLKPQFSPLPNGNNNWAYSQKCFDDLTRKALNRANKRWPSLASLFLSILLGCLSLKAQSRATWGVRGWGEAARDSTTPETLTWHSFRNQLILSSCRPAWGRFGVIAPFAPETRGHVTRLASPWGLPRCGAWGLANNPPQNSTVSAYARQRTGAWWRHVVRRSLRPRPPTHWLRVLSIVGGVKDRAPPTPP